VSHFFETRCSSVSRAVSLCLSLVGCQVEDIETKIDMLLDMYKEDRLEHHPRVQSSPSSPVDDVTEERQLAAAADDRTLSEPSSGARRTASLLVTSSRQQHRVKPMLRNLSDVGLRAKKRVTYSACDDDTMTTLSVDYKPALSDAAVEPHHQPLIDSDDVDNFTGVQQALCTADNDDDDANSRTSDNSAASRTADVNSQRDTVGLQTQVTCVDVTSQYVAPRQQSDSNTEQHCRLNTYQLSWPTSGTDHV